MLKKLAALIFALAIPIAHADTIQLLPLKQFLRLTGTQRIAYLKSVRQALVEFDRAAAPGFFAGFSLFAEADAASNATCVVGGVVRPLVNGKCPTGGRECNGANTFRCGKIYGEACVQREPLSSLSSRCDSQGQTDIGADNYSRISPILEKGLNDSCKSGPRSRGKACQLLQNKMESLNQQYKQDTPHQDPFPPEPKPNPSKPDDNKFSAAKNGACKNDRDQGKYGTCHAFCLTCVYDSAMAKVNGNSNFKSSANWIAMLSVVERMCDDSGSFNVISDKLMEQGWWPHKNLANLSKIGACAEESFIPYQPQGDWAATLRSQDRAKLINMSAKINGTSERGLNPRPDDGYGDAIHTGANYRPEFAEPERNSWKQKFGIAPEDAYDLFCPRLGETMSNGLNDYPARLAKLKGEGKLDSRFAKCADEALKNKEKIGAPGSNCESKNLSNSEHTVDDLKNMLKNSSGPIPMVISTDVAGHGNHCVTLTGYDETGFNLVNSWGTNQSYTHINYADAPNRMVWTVDPSCPFIGNGSQFGAPTTTGAGGKSSTAQ